MIGSHKIDFEIYQDGKKREFTDSVLSKMQLTKNASQNYGSFILTLAERYYEGDFIDEISCNAMVNIFVDDKIEMQGVLVKPTDTGQASMQSNSFKRNVIFRGFDFGYILQELTKLYAKFTNAYQRAEAEAVEKMATIYAGNKDGTGRFVADQTPGIYRVFMEALKDINEGQEYVFGDGETISQKFGEAGADLFFFDESKNFYVNAPLSIQLLQDNISVYEHIKRIANADFSDVYGDAYDPEDPIGTGWDRVSDKGKVVYRKANNGKKYYRLVVRPKMLGRNWYKNVTVELEDIHSQYSAMKDNSMIRNYFVVGNVIGLGMTEMEATGQIAKDVNSIKNFGYKPLKIDLNSVYDKADVTKLSLELANELKNWYKNSENFLYGQLSTPYARNARIGRRARFKLPKKSTFYDGYIDQMETIADAEQNRMHQVVTYSRALKVDPSRGRA